MVFRGNTSQVQRSHAEIFAFECMCNSSNGFCNQTLRHLWFLSAFPIHFHSKSWFIGSRSLKDVCLGSG